VTDDTRILGLSLVRDEELFVERVLRNALALCDRILVADNGSRDRTPELVAALADEDARIELHRVADPGKAHDLVAPLAGEDVWVFGVDGDEVYDPAGLGELRAQILAGALDEWWSISANAVHCVELDLEGSRARGYVAPPARGLTKLYNFSAIEAWDGPVPERLHAGTVRFKTGFDGSERNEQIFTGSGWDASIFRCLHMCFLRRSSRDRGKGPRPNPLDVYGRRGFRGRLRRRVPRKLMGYAKGDVVTVSTAPFFL
jgi:glycosyltransferase involved in cell wall biosynthesis